MEYTLPTEFYSFLEELLMIRKGKHPQFYGDRRYNSEAVCLKFGRLHPEDADLYARRLLEVYDRLDLPKSAINIMVKALYQGIEQSELPVKIKTRLFLGVPTFKQLDKIYDECAVDNEKVKVVYNDGYYLLQRCGKSMIRKCIM